MTEAAQPMPDRLKVRMLSLNLKWFTTAADSEGVGLKAEQFTIRPSTCAQHEPFRKDWKRCYVCVRGKRFTDSPSSRSLLRLVHASVAYRHDDLVRLHKCKSKLAAISSPASIYHTVAFISGSITWLGLMPVRSSTC